MAITEINIKEFLQNLEENEPNGKTTTMKISLREKQKINELIKKIKERTGVKLTHEQFMAVMVKYKETETQTALIQFFQLAEVRKAARNTPTARKEITFALQWHKRLMLTPISKDLQDEWLNDIGHDPSFYRDRFMADYNEGNINDYIAFVTANKEDGNIEELPALKAEQHSLQYLLYLDLLNNYLNNISNKYSRDTAEALGFKEDSI